MSVWQLTVPIEDGQMVVVTGRPQVTSWGRFSLTVSRVQPFGAGSLLKSFELLKNKLEKEGLFAAERKRSLPAMPSRIGVISSTQAAGYNDFIRILNERWGGVEVQVAHVQVQGAVAADQIINALNFFNGHEPSPEVIAIIRGGGSADDLSTFNEEPLVRAIAASRVPVVVGVGHETDVTLTDLAADVRAATPSHAAQLLVPDKKAVMRDLRGKLTNLSNRLAEDLDDQRAVVRQVLGNLLATYDRRLDEALTSVADRQRFLSAVNPDNVLSRGYAIVRGRIEIGSNIEVETQSELIKAEVKDVRKK
jgi:exodeoxyribonuclease VII large subunit